MLASFGCPGKNELGEFVPTLKQTKRIGGNLYSSWETEIFESDFRVFCFFNKRVHGLQLHSSLISDGKLQVHSSYSSVSSQRVDLPHQLLRPAMVSRFEYGLLSRNKNCGRLIWAGGCDKGGG